MISIPEAIKAGVRRVRRWDKALAVEQVTGAVTQISFNKSVAVPVHSFFDWTRAEMAGKRGSAWAEDSVRSRTHRSRDLCHEGFRGLFKGVGVTTLRDSDNAV